MKNAALPAGSIREALLDVLPELTSTYGASPNLRFTHVPPSHAKALHPDVMLVIGMRGSGKSFWWAALQSPEHRRLVDRLAPDTGMKDAQVHPGFGESPDPMVYPSQDVLASLLREKVDPRIVWKTVALCAIVAPDDPLRSIQTWRGRVNHVAKDAERFERVLKEKDEALVSAGSTWILLFDALDRCASDWGTMHRLIRGLLQLAVEFRPYRRLRLKAFLRTDQFDAAAVADFPDASKIVSERVELSWPDRELYSLLWQHLGNAPNHLGKMVREYTTLQFSQQWLKTELGQDTVWRPPLILQRDDKVQRAALHLLTGPWMGRDHRRGFPYSWIPGHLADGRGQVSPRSFLAALRAATIDSKDRYAQHGWPLHYESIKRGVQKASEIRVAELREDYPWVGTLMEPLRGEVVPCPFELIAIRWKKAGALEQLRSVAPHARLPPAHLDAGAAGVRADLEQLGLFVRMNDERINIPDVFRVGYGIGRRGGVKPVARG